MAEITFKSAGVKTREIDLSQPTRLGPVGIPAGIIGTALEGPAFVPLTFANFSDFITAYGASDGEKFGPIAVSQWLTNAQAVTYMRVLGIGDGKQRNSNGTVTNAGFTVGGRIVQESGIIGDNAFANSGVGAVEGRAYFLGCFMSESLGSTIFSDAGIQKASIGNLTASVTITSAGAPSAGQAITLTTADGTSATFTGHSSTQNDSLFAVGSANNGLTGLSSSIAAKATVKDKLIIRALGSNSFRIHQATAGHDGNTTIANNLANVSIAGGTAGAAGEFTGGLNLNHAVPILRGVLLAPSGVLLHLSASRTSNGSQAPLKTSTATSADNVISGREGSITGSLNLATQEFVLLMNGYGNTDVSKTTHITASFDMTSPNYFANILNTNPFKIEEEGHLLYGHYDVYPDLAVVTGSGALKAGVYANPEKTKEDIALLLTSSLARNAGSSTVPNYEDFGDRFTHASSPFIISQNFAGTPKDLFRIHMLSAGAGVSNKFKFSIENIRKSSSTTNLYGTFDLIVRQFTDTDEEPRVVESFRGLSLDPMSDRYIARVIGDQDIKYNFDVAEASQKLIVEGNHPVRSRYIRVEVAADVASGIGENTALPLGFRGPNHLVTSGSLLANEPDNAYMVSTIVQSIVEPPVPYRKTIAVGTGIQKKSDTRLYWGVNTVRQTSATQPNLASLFDKSFNTYSKHFPSHRTDSPNFSVGNNAGTADSNGAILDSDRFNNNKFSLENILVRTGADGLADPEQWLSASFLRRNASVGDINHGTKVRGFSVDDLGKVANTRYAKFTFFAQGGFDGVNMFDEEKSKLSNTAVKREMDDTSSSGVSDNTVASYRKALNIMNSKDDVDIQVLAVPGIRHSSVTDYAIQKIEDRFDAIYIMDIEERDQVNTVITSSVQKPHVSNTVTSFKNRALDTSFAAAYFPDVVVTDPSTQTLVQVPPSVAVLGAYSLNDRVAHPWFAPAGFTRGALNTVEMPSVKLNRTNLDDLYEADINPIAEFPGVGITIWGQKTLQADNSALDRINVRRLLIDVRRKIRNIANSLLFEPNREETLERFTSLVNPILQRVQEQSGVERFKAVIDTSTTTQADVENNTIRGKIFLQPTRSVEFVALDFVVTNAGSNI